MLYNKHRLRAILDREWGLRFASSRPRRGFFPSSRLLDFDSVQYQLATSEIEKPARGLAWNYFLYDKYTIIIIYVYIQPTCWFCFACLLGLKSISTPVEVGLKGCFRSILRSSFTSPSEHTRSGVLLMHTLRTPLVRSLGLPKVPSV